jgi:thiamine-monophosphate kinase
VSWSEDRIHRWLARTPRPRALFGSVGHDAAVVRALRGRPVVCVDQTVEGVHFESRAKPIAVGRKAAARAISDLAATAAKPVGVWLALSASPAHSEAWMRAVISGVRAMARELGADLLGGDLSCARGPARISVTALGEFESKSRPPGRNRARRGDIVVVTGALGGSSLGRHLRVVPRVAEGGWLFEHGARAMMDVSDGLAWDLYRLARASDVAVELMVECIPTHADAARLARHSGKTRLWHALHDGEDHEIVATLPWSALATLAVEKTRRCPGLAVIGRVRAIGATGLYLCDGAGRTRRWRTSEGGFRHGG